MKLFRILLFSYFLVLFGSLFALNQSPYQFISPKPSSIMVYIETNIIVSHSSNIDQATLSTDLM